MIRTLYASSAAALLVFAGTVSSHATGVAYDAALASPPGVYFGTGNVNSSFTVDTDGGIELGLSAITRFLGPITPTGNVYDVPLGDTTVPLKSGAAWGFDFSINLQPGGSGSLTLGDITANLSLVDVGQGTSGTGFSPFLIPDNTEFGSSGAQDCSKVTCSADNYAVQNSEALSFTGIKDGFGDPAFTDSVNDTYIITLDVDGPTGALLASDTIVVNAGTGAPVPEPASLILLGTGLLGLAARLRRRKA